MATGVGLKLAQVAQILEAGSLTGQVSMDRMIRVVCASDLMSDVLCFGRRADLLVTSLTNAQAVRTAEVSDIPAICFLHDKVPAADVVALARETGIALLRTPRSMFNACAALAAAGIEGCGA
jgi:hypothetical protein